MDKEKYYDGLGKIRLEHIKKSQEISEKYYSKPFKGLDVKGESTDRLKLRMEMNKKIDNLREKYNIKEDRE